MSDLKTYREAVATAPENIKRLLESDQVALFVDKLEQQSTIQINRQSYLILISDYLVGLTTAEEVEIVLKKDLEPALVPNILQEIDQLSNVTLDSNVVNQVPTNNPVTPVRTMAEDMQAAQGEQTYSSSQDALIQPQTQVPTPPPVAPQVPTPPQPPQPPVPTPPENLSAQ